MPGIHRLSDITSAHGCPPGGSCGVAPATIAGTASGNVLVNGRGAVRLSDMIIPHACAMCGALCIEVCSPHTGVYLGVRTVFVNGRPVQTVGDPISCTCIAVGGSPNVWAN